MHNRSGIMLSFISLSSTVRKKLTLSCLFISSIPFLMGAATLTQRITIEQHLFYPSRIYVPENTPIQLLIHNLDETPEEFDSFALNREKVIFPQRPSIIYLPKLAPGEYGFIGEYHPDTARGLLIVLPQHQYATYMQSQPLNSTLIKGDKHVNQ